MTGQYQRSDTVLARCVIRLQTCYVSASASDQCDFVEPFVVVTQNWPATGELRCVSMLQKARCEALRSAGYREQIAPQTVLPAVLGI